MKLKTFFLYIFLGAFLSSCCNSKSDDKGASGATSALLVESKTASVVVDSNAIDSSIVSILQDIGFVNLSNSNGVIPLIAFKDTANVGAAGSPNCHGASVCSYYAEGTALNYSYFAGSSELVMSFNIRQLKNKQPEKVAYFEGKKAVTFDSDWIIPEKVKNGLNINGKAVVKAGIPFLIAHKGNTYAVILKVEK